MNTLSERVRAHKYMYVFSAINELRCDYFCVEGADAVEIATHLGASLDPTEQHLTRVVFSPHSIYDPEHLDTKVRGWYIHLKEPLVFPVPDVVLDLAFIHYSQLIPVEILINQLKSEAEAKIHILQVEVEKELIQHGFVWEKQV